MKNLLPILPLLLLFSFSKAQTYTLNVSGYVFEETLGTGHAGSTVYLHLDSTVTVFVLDTSMVVGADGYFEFVLQVPNNVSSGTGYVRTVDYCTLHWETSTFSYSAANNIHQLQNFIICGYYGSCAVRFHAVPTGTPNEISFSNVPTNFGGSTQSLITNYIWDFGDGGSSTLDNPLHTYAAPGNYEVCLQVIWQDGCMHLFCDTVVVGGSQAACSISWTYGLFDTQINGFELTTNGPRKLVKWIVTVDSILAAVGTFGRTSYSFAGGGNYNVCVDAYFTDSCVARVCSTMTIAGPPPCNADFIYGPDTSSQYTVLVYDLSSGSNLRYHWDFGDGDTSALQYPTHQYAGAGTYLVCLTVTDSVGGCVDMICQAIPVLNLMDVPFSLHVVAGTTSGINQTSAEINLEIFPNPADQTLQLSLGFLGFDAAIYQLMKLEGQVVREGTVNGNGNEEPTLISIGDLPEGLYWLEVTIGEKRIGKRLLVMH